jgi:hypothetical protein
VSSPPFPGLGPGPEGRRDTQGGEPFPGLGSPFPGLGSPFPGSSGADLPGADLPGAGFPGVGAGAGGTRGDPFPVGGGTSAAGPLSGPPTALFAAAAAAPVVSLPLLLLDGWGWHVLGWVVATFVTAGLLIAATLQDTHRRASVWYTGSDGLIRGLRTGAVVLALLAAAAHAWLFADWFSRLAVFSS